MVVSLVFFMMDSSCVGVILTNVEGLDGERR